MRGACAGEGLTWTRYGKTTPHRWFNNVTRTLMKRIPCLRLL